MRLRSRANIANFQARNDVRLFGSCVLTSSSRNVHVVDLQTPEAFSTVPVDGEVRSIVGLSPDDSSAFAFAAGGAETAAQTASAAQLYRLPLDGCVPDRALTVPGGARSQADIIGVGARADGVVFVGDAAEAVWSVR